MAGASFTRAHRRKVAMEIARDPGGAAPSLVGRMPADGRAAP